MQPEQPPSNHASAAGLPPVVPPSGRHIVQLFVVPGLIVVGILVLFLGCFGFWGVFFGFGGSPQRFISDLEDGNPDVRWRGAYNLAQVLKRDETLASDPKLGLRLAELLHRALDERERDKNVAASRPPSAVDGDAPLENKSQKAQRKYIQFLSSCLGNMNIPVGAPVLVQMAQKDVPSSDPVATVLRRHAVWTLANLGENRKRFDALPQARRETVLALLQEDADANHGARSDWAKKTLGNLQGTGELGVIGGLAKVREIDFERGDADPFLRRMVAFALTFWEGMPEENKLAEQTLALLSRDDGHGALVDVSEVD